MDAIEICDAQFVIKASGGTGLGGLVPRGMGATGIRPKPRRMIFVKGALLDQNPPAVHHKNAHGLMPQAAQMRVELFNGGQRSIDPSRNENRIGHFCHIVGLAALLNHGTARDIICLNLCLHSRNHHPKRFGGPDDHKSNRVGRKRT